MAAGNRDDQALGAALDGIAAGLALPFAAGDIGFDLGMAELLEAHDRLAQAFAQGAVGAAQRDGRKHAVAAAGEQGEAGARGRLVFGLGQNAAAASDHRVARQYAGIRRGYGQRLFAGHAAGIVARHFAGLRGFVDVGGLDRVWRYTKAHDQFAPAGTGRCQDELGHQLGHQCRRKGLCL